MKMIFIFRGKERMTTKTSYRTRQRELLMQYLETVPGTHITVADICDYFRREGSSIGQTTVYRQLERLVEEGVVNKYFIDANGPACFEYVPGGAHLETEYCFHCKCEKCGRLIHLHCDELAGIRKHLLEHHHFTMDPMRTVFYGICDQCSPMRMQAAGGRMHES